MTDPTEWYEMGADAGDVAALAVELDVELARNFLNGMARDKLVCPAAIGEDESLVTLFGKVFPPEAPIDYTRGFRESWEDTLTERCSDLLSDVRPESMRPSRMAGFVDDAVDSFIGNEAGPAFQFNWTDDTPIPDAIGQAMGAASVCWDPVPTGVFQSEMAMEVLDKLLEFLQRKAVGL